jgi:hypothetical protein
MWRMMLGIDRRSDERLRAFGAEGLAGGIVVTGSAIRGLRSALVGARWSVVASGGTRSATAPHTSPRLVEESGAGSA